MTPEEAKIHFKTHLRYSAVSHALHEAGIECGYMLSPWRLFIRRKGEWRYISLRRGKRIAALDRNTARGR